MDKSTGRTPEARELLDRLHAEVGKLVTGDDWRQMLDLTRQMHSYSFGNLLLMHSQRDGVTIVAGYKRWQDLGRHVRKGERGIRILAPVVVKRRDEENDEGR